MLFVGETGFEWQTSTPVVLTLGCVRVTRRADSHRLLKPLPGVPGSLALAGLKVSISNTFPRDAAAAGLRTTL